MRASKGSKAAPIRPQLSTLPILSALSFHLNLKIPTFGGLIYILIIEI
jgi:hypothetical protein